LEKLTLTNRKEQNNERFRKSKNETEDLSIIKYSHLIDLDLFKAHKDYLEQFLLHTRTYLPNDVYLYTDHQSLKKVTRHFTRDETRNRYFP
jgi:hypothetical protein